MSVAKKGALPACMTTEAPVGKDSCVREFIVKCCHSSSSAAQTILHYVLEVSLSSFEGREEGMDSDGD